MAQLAYCLARADILDEVVEPNVPVDLRAAIQVAAFLQRLGQAERLPEVPHRGVPVPPQHLQHQAYAEHAPRGAGRVAGLLRQGQRPAPSLAYQG